MGLILDEIKNCDEVELTDEQCRTKKVPGYEHWAKNVGMEELIDEYNETKYRARVCEKELQQRVSRPPFHSSRKVLVGKYVVSRGNQVVHGSYRHGHKPVIDLLEVVDESELP